MMGDSIDWRLDNWGHVMGRIRGGADTCDSIEKLYRGSTQYNLEERRIPRAVADRRDAELVERAWVSMENGRSKNLLRLHYVRRCPFDFICRRIGIGRDLEDFEWARLAAVSEIGYALAGMREAA